VTTRVRPRRYADRVRRHLLTIPAVVLGAALLSGCTPGDSGGGLVGTVPTSPAPTSTPATATPSTPAPSPTADADPSPEPKAAPECKAIASLEWLKSNFDDQLDGPDEFDFSGDGLPGPTAQNAAAQSDDLISCAWGIPYSDGVFTVSVLAITPEAEEPLVAALQSSAKYDARADSYIGPDGVPAPTFSHTFEDGIGFGLAYAFYDGYWVIASGTMISPDDAVVLTQKALTAATAAG